MCARLTGAHQAAEDLAHESLTEALRHAHRLRDPGRRRQWLAGIARNVCLRWARTRGREAVRTAQELPDAASAARDAEESLADGFDLKVELERNELARLLDRAMAMLPSQTRAVLVDRFVEQSPHAEIAARLGLSEGAVAMRLQRGKLALRRLLRADLWREAAAYGLPRRCPRRLAGDRALVPAVRSAPHARADRRAGARVLAAVSALADTIAGAGYGAGLRGHGGHAHGGHAIGLEHLERPYVIAGDAMPLAEGMVLTLEPGVYLSDVGLRLEDNYLVTAGGLEPLSHFSRELVACG